jgi:hypothetical protein
MMAAPCEKSAEAKSNRVTERVDTFMIDYEFRLHRSRGCADLIAY